MAIPEIIWNYRYCNEIDPPYLESFHDAVKRTYCKIGTGPRLIRECIISAIFENDFILNQRDLVNIKIADIHLLRVVIAVSHYGELKLLVTNFYDVFGPILKEHIVLPK